MRKTLALALALGLLTGAMASAGAAPKAVTVWEDASGDATLGGQAPQSIPAGWDLTGATIAKNGANLEFTVTHADMPPVGSLPEGSRFLWNIAVNGEPYRLVAKSADIGKPDVVAGQTTERVGRADTAGHFRLEGECVQTATPAVTIINCPPLEYLEGSFDPASMSLTIIVPLKSIKAKTGSVITQGQDQICMICWVSHVAERSHSQTIIDTAVQTVNYKVPK